MSPLPRIKLALILTSLFTLTAQSKIKDFTQLCFRYYGSASAEVTFPNLNNHKNYDGNITCPSTWNFNDITGGTLVICPPAGDNIPDPDGSDIQYVYRETGSTVAFDFRLPAEDHLRHTLEPLSDFSFKEVLVNNASFAYHPQDGISKPAILTADPESSPAKYTINGSGAAVYPRAYNPVRLDCTVVENPSPSQYCGVYEDDHEGGCWSSQTLELGSGWSVSDMNFTIVFGEEASLEIWVQEPYLPVYRDGEYSGPGFSTAAYIVFRGERGVPDKDLNFWANAYHDYEKEKEEDKGSESLYLEPGLEGLPVFGDRESGDWYGSGNGSFHIGPVGGNGGVSVSGDLGKTLGVGGILGLFFLLV